MHEHVTLLHPEAAESVAQGPPPGIPADLLRQSAERLSTVALLYSCAFFLAGVLPMLVVPSDRALLFDRFIHWGPSPIAIIMGLVGVAVASPGRAEWRQGR
ncbi:MAG: hypothetical protein ACREMH_11655 [Gemmatimonadales bacterium]